MQEETALQSEHQTTMRAWEQNAPWYRRFFMRFGLQRKLIICFMSLLIVAMVVTGYIFDDKMHDRLSDIAGEQARQVATALSLTSQASIDKGNWDDLNECAQQLIKSRNIVYVAYLDTAAHVKSVASRDVDFGAKDSTFGQPSLMQPRSRYSPTFGEYVEVVAPILSYPPLENDARDHHESSQLLGYVAVGISQNREESQLQSAHFMVVGIACIVMLIALPVASVLVHGLFLPIRKLVAVTKDITAGNLDARTEIYRPDQIGDLARAFDEMVTRVKQQQQALARANEQLADANRSLERKVELRTAQLETANSRLSDEIIEKESFLRAVSHDLNAPLRNISGMATMLLMKHRDRLDEDMTHRLTRIKSNVDLESELIAELLELSRIKTRRQKMELVSVGKMIMELRDLFENDLTSESIKLIIDTPLPILHAERARIRQIFQNLLDNAVKYMGKGATREIHIGCEFHPTEAEFYVRDTGTGIEASDAEKIFFVFRRGKSSSSQPIAGKGVGLATVKSIVETYNGKIWVTGEVGVGSTFRFTINGKFVADPPDQADTGKAA